jgi:hypothetical protein
LFIIQEQKAVAAGIIAKAFMVPQLHILHPLGLLFVLLIFLIITNKLGIGDVGDYVLKRGSDYAGTRLTNSIHEIQEVGLLAAKFSQRGWGHQQGEIASGGTIRGHGWTGWCLREGRGHHCRKKKGRHH